MAESKKITAVVARHLEEKAKTDPEMAEALDHIKEMFEKAAEAAGADGNFTPERLKEELEKLGGKVEKIEEVEVEDFGEMRNHIIMTRPE